jgi:hypothetical protein
LLKAPRSGHMVTSIPAGAITFMAERHAEPSNWLEMGCHRRPTLAS